MATLASGTSFDVVIVGAGIGGAVLALALARRGWHSVVLEREPSARTLVRPEVLWGATLRSLDTVGAGDLVRHSAILLRGVELRRSSTGASLIIIREQDFASGGVEGWSTDPTQTRERILQAAISTGKVTVRRGMEVKALLRDGSQVLGVTAVHEGTSVEFRASLTVGDDGAHSVVRTQLQVPIATRLFPLEFLSALIRWPAELPPERVRGWVNLGDGSLPAAVLIPWPEGRGVLLVPVPLERVIDDFWTELSKVTPLASHLATQLDYPRDFSRVRRPFGHAERYAADGAALIGDAIHPMSPAGGQGANASIADAMALAAVADEALRSGDVSAARLRSYEDRRRSANARSVGISAIAERSFRMAGPLAKAGPLIPFLLTIASRLGLPRRGLRFFSTAFVGGEEVRR